jgi:hypothetical protein
LIEKLANWLESLSQPCLYKALLGIECPGCGMQRSFIEILKGNFLDSLLLYPALMPTLVLVIFLFVHLSFKLKEGAVMLKVLFMVNALIIVLHYIYKILTN